MPISHIVKWTMSTLLLIAVTSVVAQSQKKLPVIDGRAETRAAGERKEAHVTRR